MHGQMSDRISASSISPSEQKLIATMPLVQGDQSFQVLCGHRVAKPLGDPLLHVALAHRMGDYGLIARQSLDLRHILHLSSDEVQYIRDVPVPAGAQEDLSDEGLLVRAVLYADFKFAAFGGVDAFNLKNYVRFSLYYHNICIHLSI